MNKYYTANILKYFVFLVLPGIVQLIHINMSFFENKVKKQEMPQ